MGFKETLLFIMNMVRKTLQVELNNFYENLLKTDETISKQAYCEARQKIDPKAFIELNDQTTKLFHENFDDLKLWNGYRLSAVDGSVLEIPDTKLLRETFGCSGNQNRMVARAKASCLFDVLNKIIIKSIIDRYPTPERESAKYLIDETIESGRKNDLILFDRRYPSAGFISYLHNCGIKFLIRSLKNHFSKVIEPGKEDQIVRISYNGATIRLRVVRILLPSGEVEILITNLLDKEYTIPIRPERSNKRIKRKVKGKYKTNHKRCL